MRATRPASRELKTLHLHSRGIPPSRRESPRNRSCPPEYFARSNRLAAASPAKYLRRESTRARDLPPRRTPAVIPVPRSNRKTARASRHRLHATRARRRSDKFRSALRAPTAWFVSHQEHYAEFPPRLLGRDPVRSRV